MRRRNQSESDATLRSLAGDLANPEEFVRLVLGNMEGYCKDCQVRVAINTNPAWPDYRVEMLFYDFDEGTEVAHAQPVAVFNGRNHVGAIYGDDEKLRAWSSAAMTFVEVQNLIGHLRGVGR